MARCIDSPAFKNAVTQFGHLVFTWSVPNVGMYSFVDWFTRLDTRLERLVRSFADIAEACRRHERERGRQIAAGRTLVRVARANGGQEDAKPELRRQDGGSPYGRVALLRDRAARRGRDGGRAAARPSRGGGSAWVEADVAV